MNWQKVVEETVVKETVAEGPLVERSPNEKNDSRRIGN